MQDINTISNADVIDYTFLLEQILQNLNNIHTFFNDFLGLFVLVVGLFSGLLFAYFLLSFLFEGV